MADDYVQVYDVAGFDARPKQRDYIDSKQTYTLPVARTVQQTSEYELPQRRTQQPAENIQDGWNNTTGSEANKHKVEHVQKGNKRCLTAITVAIILLSVLTISAVAISILSWQELGITNTVSQSQVSQESTNITQMLKQINELNKRFNDLISAVDANYASIFENFSQRFTSEVNNLSDELQRLQQDMRRINFTLQTYISTTNRNVSMLANRVDSRLRDPYQNCIQEKVSCAIGRLLNDDRRLLCTTGTLRVNRTVS